MLASLKHRKHPGGHRQRLYVDIITSHVSDAVNQLIGQAGRVVQISSVQG